MNKDHAVAPSLTESRVREFGFKQEALPILQNMQSVTIAQIRQLLRTEVLGDFMGLVGTIDRAVGFLGSLGISVRPTSEDGMLPAEKSRPQPVQGRRLGRPKLNGVAAIPKVADAFETGFTDERPPGHLDPLEQYLRDIGRIARITKKDEVELARRIKKGDEAAREQMIGANLRLVVLIAKRYQGLGMPLLDLINEGNLGLMRAAEMFDSQKGAGFATYSSFWIKQAIRRALSNQSRDIRLPVHMFEKVTRLRRATAELRQELERSPTDDEVAERLGIKAETVRKMWSATAEPVRLDAKVGDDGDITLADLIPDDRAADPSKDSSTHDTNRIRALLSRLSPRDRQILAMRFGLDDGGEGLTLEQTGEAFGITRERIRQLQVDALGRLRALMNGKAYRRP